MFCHDKDNFMPKTMSFSRRQLLKMGLAAGGALAMGGCSSSTISEPDLDMGIRAFNVHPYTDAVMPAQLKAITDMRITWIRITLGILRDIAGSYVSAVNADILGLISDFDLRVIDKGDWPDMVDTVIRRYPSLTYFQILNEPELFHDIGAREYVRDYLRPAHDVIRTRFPYVKIVSAAPIGQPSGIRDFVEMTSAGADDYCDYRAVHIYFEDDLFSPWSAFRRATERPIMVTETGVRRPDEHLSWWQSQIPQIKQTLHTEFVFYYVLLDHPVSTGFEVIDGTLDSQGNVVSASGSQLYQYLRGQ